VVWNDFIFWKYHFLCTLKQCRWECWIWKYGISTNQPNMNKMESKNMKRSKSFHAAAIAWFYFSFLYSVKTNEAQQSLWPCLLAFQINWHKQEFPFWLVLCNTCAQQQSHSCLEENWGPAILRWWIMVQLAVNCRSKNLLE